LTYLVEFCCDCCAPDALFTKQNSAAWEGLASTEKLFSTRYF
jgi:hypothetical protein